MAFVFHRREAMPLLGMAVLALAATASPPTTLFLTILGIAAMAYTITGFTPWLRSPRSGVQLRAHGGGLEQNGPLLGGPGACLRTSDEPNAASAQDTLDLVRMDDDGGWQMPRTGGNRSPAGDAPGVGVHR